MARLIFQRRSSMMAKARRHPQQVEWGRILAQHMASSLDCKTQEALARKSGVAPSTIGRILRGETDPQIGTMAFLAQALRTTLKALVAERQKPVEPSDVDRALFQALVCRKNREGAEQALDTLRREENDAIERLQDLVSAQRGRRPTTPTG